MLMFTRTHARLAASDAKKIGEQARLIAKQRAEIDECKATSEKVFRANLKLAADLQQVRSQLGKFTGPRQRDTKGRYQPLSRKFAPVNGAQA